MFNVALKEGVDVGAGEVVGAGEYDSERNRNTSSGIRRTFEDQLSAWKPWLIKKTSLNT